MAKVYRVFAEKKKGNDIEASNMLNDLKENVGIKGIEELRIINRYDAQGLSEDEFKAAVNGVFSEPNLDNVYFELKLDDEWKYFATEFLPGQYDQRADSAAQCIQLLTAGERPEVASAKVIAVKGDITDAELDKIKAYVINPVESRLASMDKPESRHQERHSRRYSKNQRFHRNERRRNSGLPRKDGLCNERCGFMLGKRLL